MVLPHVEYARWPETTLQEVPPTREATNLASGLRSALGLGDAPLGRIESICAVAGVVVRQIPLRGAQGGLEASLTPRVGGFEVTVDTEPRGGWGLVPSHLREMLQRHRLRFRIAHELGHTFFYDRSGDRPRRIVPDSEEQEVFCDEFARAFLIPSAAIPPRLANPRVVAELSRSYDVSLEVAARATAAHSPDLWLGLYVRRSGKTSPQWLSSMSMGPPWISSWVSEWDTELFDSPLHRNGRGWSAAGVGLAGRRQIVVIARRTAS